jgi:hypothetical protein
MWYYMGCFINPTIHPIQVQGPSEICPWTTVKKHCFNVKRFSDHKEFRCYHRCARVFI